MKLWLWKTWENLLFILFLFTVGLIFLVFGAR